MNKQVVVTGAFDDLRSGHIRFLEEASRLGDLTVLLWSDDVIQQVAGQPPEFPEHERVYLLRALRYVQRVELSSAFTSHDSVPDLDSFTPDIWVVGACRATPGKEAFCRSRGIAYHVIPPEHLEGIPEPDAPAQVSGRKKVVVTGCYDWFHSGHVRFFEEVSAYGDLYVIVGHDANIRLLKGAGHPLLPQDERRYVCGSVRYVKQALISSGEGWLDADPEIRRLKPDIYAVNEDGDKGGKREYCEQLGIEYLVLKRTPAPGLPQRSSTNLRGF
jgi:cytidyltransferase-like protein